MIEAKPVNIDYKETYSPMMDATIFRYLICLTVLKWLDLVSPETKSKLLKNKTDKYMHLGIILIGIIRLHHKEIGALININL